MVKRRSYKDDAKFWQRKYEEEKAKGDSNPDENKDRDSKGLETQPKNNQISDEDEEVEVTDE